MVNIKSFLTSSLNVSQGAFWILGFTLVACTQQQPQTPIDREALLERNSPVVTTFDSLQSLTVGNGGFAYTVDATGMQTFPEAYSKGVPLGTQSDWGWHSFPNTEKYDVKETLAEYDFGHGHKELYATKIKGNPRAEAAYEYVRINPHRLHLGTVGLYLGGDVTQSREHQPEFTDMHQRLDLKSGIITSEYKLNGEPVKVQTCANPHVDLVAWQIESSQPRPLVVRLPYPTGGHSDDACNWDDTKNHSSELEAIGENSLNIRHNYDDENANYWLDIDASCPIKCEQIAANTYVITPSEANFGLTCEWCSFSSRPESANGYDPTCSVEHNFEESTAYWNDFWKRSGMVDMSECTDERAKELERRIVLSQYLLAVNCAGDTPPQETGLTYNSWFGKYHMEMVWWHQAQFALWGHPELLERSLEWYSKVEPIARDIAQRQGFGGVRWMKMTDPSGLEAPSTTGSFLIWQQPHYIYLSELVRRAYEAQGDKEKVKEVESKYYDLVQATAQFMADFATYDTMPNRYVLKGYIPAQETLRASQTINAPFELSQWHYTMGVANEWRERHEGLKNLEWEELRDKLSPLHYIEDSVYFAKYGLLYTASEDSEDTFRDIRLTSDHMSVLGALGIFPKCPLVREDVMRNTLHWVWDNWNWGKTWGWDYPMTSMCAARLGEYDKAVEALLVPYRTNTYLVSGHNYQDSRLRLYLPGNGGLLTAVALLCTSNAFPKDGKWNVKYEGILPMPK